MYLATVLALAGYFVLACATAYIVLTVLAVWLRSFRGDRAEAETGVSVLKPLYGDEPQLLENLRSFCRQRHPDYQILLGIHDASDAALAVARRVQAEFPQIDIDVIVDARLHGLNPKVSNLMNLLPHARHDWLVIADSDIAVAPDYLRRVTAPLSRPDVGLVTCLYRGRPIGGLWSRVGSQFIDQWFRPSVALEQMFGARRFGFGATLALRRETLAAIGGFEAVSGIVADDYWLGEKIADLGLETLLSDHEVITDVCETRLSDLMAHELRWFRTIRSVRPLSYLFTGICFTVPVTTIGVALTGLSLPALSIAAVAVAARLCLMLESHLRTARWRDLPANIAAFLLRDTLSLLLWAWAFSSGKVRWRGQQMTIDTLAKAGTPYEIPMQVSSDNLTP